MRYCYHLEVRVLPGEDPAAVADAIEFDLPPGMEPSFQFLQVINEPDDDLVRREMCADDEMDLSREEIG